MSDKKEICFTDMGNKVNIHAILEDCKNISITECIVEALINSIQAINSQQNNKQPKIKCKIKTNNNKITSIEIIDNGEGFNNKNISKFETFLAKHQEDDINKQGCKGYGRIYYKKLFDIVEICSFNSDKNNEKVEFSFTENDFTDKITTLHNHTHGNNETSLLLAEPINNILFDNNLIGDYGEIFNNVYPYFLLSGNKELKIIFYVDEVEKYIIDYNSIRNIDETKKDFEIDGEKFYLYYTLSKNNNGKIITTICWKKRPLFEASFNNKPLQINLSLNGYNGLFILKSDWIDKQEVDKNHKLKSCKNWDKIKPQVIKKLLEIIKPILDKDKIKRGKKEYDYNGYVKQQKIDLTNKYPDCAEYIKNYESIGIIDDNDIILSAIDDTNNKEKEAIKNENKTNQEELFAGALARYIRHRQEIIEQIAVSFKNAQDKEEYIHNLIVPQRNDNLKLYDNNLWLFDDKFLGYNEIYSDEELKKIVEAGGKTIATNTNNMDGCQPDIVFFKNTSNGTPKIVIIELKRPNVSWADYVKGDEQLRQYAEYLVQERKVCNQVYGFLLVSSEALKENNYENQTMTYLYDQYKPIYSSAECIDNALFIKTKELYGKFNNGIKPTIGTITITAILSNSLITDAKTRNQTFIDILNGKYIDEIKNSKI